MSMMPMPSGFNVNLGLAASSQTVAQENAASETMVELCGLRGCQPETGICHGLPVIIRLTERSPVFLSLLLLLQPVVKTVRGGLPQNLFSKKDSMALL